MQDKKFLPAFYFPSTSLMLDDDHLFLENFSANLNLENIATKISNSPHEALQILKAQDYQQFSSLGLQDINGTEESDIDELALVGLNVKAIQKLSTNTQRYACISSLIVDYDMPEMTGIEFCQQIQELPVKKIMLTGHGSHKLAVDAFNRGIINQFIVKDTNTIFNETVAAIKNCQQQFFQGLTSHLLNVLSSKSSCAIRHKNFKDKLWSVIQDVQGVEYYLIDEYGSYLICSADGSEHYFVVRPDSIFDDYADIAKNNEITPKLIKTIESREALPILLNDVMDQLPVEAWTRYMKPVKPLSGDRRFYVAEWEM